MESKVKLVKIPESEVTAHPKNYNSGFHQHEPEVQSLTDPTERPQNYSRWLPLIAQSQGFNPADVQTVMLSPSLGRLIVAASSSSIQTRQLNRLYADELKEELAPGFCSLKFGTLGLFIRFDACSPKDGVGGALRSVEDIILKLTTSTRARNAVTRLLEDGSNNVPIHFLPFNSNMNTILEYRVFCAPPDGRITAVSQYSWYRRSPYAAKKDDDLVQIVEKIMKEVHGVHSLILEEAKNGSSNNREMGSLMLEQGFSFDIMWKEEEQKCMLIELNGFGARSGCGSCLYHWIRDIDVLYGRKADKGIEFRVCV